MGRSDPSDTVSRRLSEALGESVTELTPVGGGTFGRPYRASTESGRRYFVKVADDDGSSVLAEADGLRWLAEATPGGGATVASVVATAERMLVLDWIESGTATTAAAADFGRSLARTHAAGADRFGGPAGGFIASEPLPSGEGIDSWPEFYAEARLQPFLHRASDEGNLSDDDRAAVRAVIDRIETLAGPVEPPARLHGDLWSGNVVWAAGSAVLIDPSAHGGHRETDLAMLALFGLPGLDAVLEAYQQAAPLAPGWRDRVSLHQLYPLLVHATLFGGSYGRAAGSAARSALSAGSRRSVS